MTIKNGVLDWAKQKPLGPQTEPPIDPQVLIYHIIVGSATAGYNVFHAQGYTGDESTLILCGPRDVKDGHKDGEVWQLQNFKRQADAQFAGNAYADSVETSGMPNEPFSSAMLDSLIRVTVEWCREYNKSCALVPRTGPIPAHGGLGWHEWRADWNADHHVCPGAVREGQLRQIVIPKARAILAGTRPVPTPAPKTGKLEVDGVFGIDTIAAVQRVLMANKITCGCKDDKPDGVFGPATRKGLQRYLHRLGFYDGRIDGVFAVRSVTALARYLNTLHRIGEPDNMHPHDTWYPHWTRFLQQSLNREEF